MERIGILGSLNSWISHSVWSAYCATEDLDLIKLDMFCASFHRNFPGRDLEFTLVPVMCRLYIQ